MHATVLLGRGTPRAIAVETPPRTWRWPTLGKVHELASMLEELCGRQWLGEEIARICMRVDVFDTDLLKSMQLAYLKETSIHMPRSMTGLAIA